MTELLTAKSAPAGTVRGFVDVLGTLAAWPAAPEPPAGASAYLTDRHRLPLPEGPITVEHASLAAGAAGECVLPGDEFVLVVGGAVAFEQSGVRCDLAAGEAAVLMRDRPLTWRVGPNGGADLILMRCMGGGGAGAEAPVKIDPDAQLGPSNPPAAEVLLGPTPTCRGHADYRSANGEFASGVWDSTPYHRRPIQFGHYELMRLLAGSVTFVDSAGRVGRFRTGDVILFEQGGSAAWESLEYVKKIYCTFRPAP
jgi:uncharacterized cupin superfamily protein